MPIHDGLRFRQPEYVGGLRGALEAKLFDVYPEERFAWRAEIDYAPWGLTLVTIAECGLFRIEESAGRWPSRLAPRLW